MTTSTQLDVPAQPFTAVRVKDIMDNSHHMRERCILSRLMVITRHIWGDGVKIAEVVRDKGRQ
jgi:hypothetical protein